VIVMLTHSMTTPDRNATREPRGKPLFAEFLQPMHQMAHGMLLFLGGASVLVSIVMAPSRPLVLTLARLPMIAFFAFIFWLFRSTHKVYGSPEGLEVVQWGRSRSIPWSLVGECQTLPWFLSFPTRIVRLKLNETPPRTITFYASKNNLEDFEAMRVKGRNTENDE
jgi:hypothetical protein